VATVKVQVGGQGSISLASTGAIVLQKLTAADGAITVTADDTITAVDVVALTDAADRSVTLINTGGDVLVDRITVGKQSGEVFIKTPGNIRELDNTDLDYDLTGDRGVLIAGGEVGSKRNPNLNLEMDFREVSDSATLVAGDYSLAEGQGAELVGRRLWIGHALDLDDQRTSRCCDWCQSDLDLDAVAKHWCGRCRRLRDRSPGDLRARDRGR
jgi:hypothetical protein